MNKILLLAIVTLLIHGCSSSSIKIDSFPQGAEINLTKDNKSMEKIGTTPMNIDDRIVKDLFDEPIQMVLSHEGYKPQTIIVPESIMKVNAEVFVKMQENPAAEIPTICTKYADSINDISTGIARVQNLLARKKYEDAEIILNKLSATYSNVSVIFDLLGNLYYLRKDINRALRAYRKSYDLNPGNKETKIMIEKLSKINMENS